MYSAFSMFLLHIGHGPSSIFSNQLRDSMKLQLTHFAVWTSESYKWIERLCLLREKWATFFIVPALNIHPALSIQLCEEIFSYVIATVYGFSIDNCLLYLHFHPQIGAKTKGIAIFTQIETPSKPFLSLSAEQWGNLFQFFRWLRWCTAHQTKNCAFHGCSLMGILDEVRWRSHQLRYSVAPKRSPRGKIRGRYAS